MKTWGMIVLTIKSTSAGYEASRQRCSQEQVCNQKSRNLHHQNRLSKTVVFERIRRAGKRTGKSGLNPSQNSLLISASQKARVRLSFKRVHGDQTEKDCSLNRTGGAATSAGRAEGRASAIIRCWRDHVETDAARLCPRLDRRTE